MARLTREQQREYEEEMEYRQSQNSPPSTMDRIVHAAKRIGTQIQEANNSPAGQAIRSFAGRVNAEDGLGGGNAPLHTSSSARRRAFQAVNPQNPPVNSGSAFHPGNKIYVIQGQVIASGGGQKGQTQPVRHSRSLIRRGGLGQEDTGFGDDRGL